MKYMHKNTNHKQGNTITIHDSLNTVVTVLEVLNTDKDGYQDLLIFNSNNEVTPYVICKWCFEYHGNTAWNHGIYCNDLKQVVSELDK